MPLSIVFSLILNSSVPLAQTGRWAESWALDELGLGDYHEAFIKPFTVSALLGAEASGRPGQRWTHKNGSRAALRLTVLDADLCLRMKERLSGRRRPASVRLKWENAAVEDLTWDSARHALAGEENYGDLVHLAPGCAPMRRFMFDFLTPTYFSDGKKDVPLPEPARVFGSLLRRWNTFAPPALHFDEILGEFAAHAVAVLKIENLNTVVCEGKNNTVTAFTGRVEYALLPQNKLPEELQPCWTDSDLVLQALARYAFYCGAGKHTTWGFGQVIPFGGRPPREASPELRRVSYVVN